MYLENLVVDAVEPQRLGRFWETVVGGERLTDEFGPGAAAGVRAVPADLGPSGRGDRAPGR